MGFSFEKKLDWAAYKHKIIFFNNQATLNPLYLRKELTQIYQSLPVSANTTGSEDQTIRLYYWWGGLKLAEIGLFLCYAAGSGFPIKCTGPGGCLTDAHTNVR